MTLQYLHVDKVTMATGISAPVYFQVFEVDTETFREKTLSESSIEKVMVVFSL